MEEKEREDSAAAGLGGTEGDRRSTGVPPSPAAAAAGGKGSKRVPAPAVPDPEVLEKPVRRRFTAAEKLQILAEADACDRHGQVGALMRREGLYSSLLRSWRRQRDAGALDALKPKQRGRKPQPVNPLTAENDRLQRENERLAARLKQAEMIIDVQKKVSEILGLTTPPERNI